jgi:hypothetical protein
MKILTKALLLATVALWTGPASADEFIGLLVGPSFVNNSVGLRPVFGFETAGKLDPHWSLGFNVNFENLGTKLSSSTDSATLTAFLAGVTYHGWENNRGPWIGLRAGIGVLNNAGSIAGAGSVGGSANSLAYGVSLGYDKQLGEEWTWGPQGQVVMVNAPGGSVMTLNAVLTIRYWPL